MFQYQFLREHHLLYWDRTIQTNHLVIHNRPDIVLWDKRAQRFKIIDIAIPLDKGRVRISEVDYEVNTSTIGWKEIDVCRRNNWLFSFYGRSIYFVIYFANSDTPKII